MTMNEHNTMNKDNNYTIQNESLKITTVLSRLDFRITSKNSYYVAHDKSIRLFLVSTIMSQHNNVVSI